MSDIEYVTLHRSTLVACVRGFVVGAMLMVGFGAIAGYYAHTSGQAQESAATADQQRGTWVAQAKGLSEQIAKSDVCKSDDPADITQFGYLCEQARKIKSEPEPDPVDTQALAAAVAALVVASLPERIDKAVVAYMSAHPTASRDEVRQWVREEVAANPAAPGKDGKPGKDGAAGPMGPGPTDAQVDAAVARWFEANPPQRCGPGEVSQETLYPDGVYGSRCVKE